MSPDPRPLTPDPRSDVLISVEGVRKKFCRSLKRSLWYGMQDMVSELCGGSSKHEQLRKNEFWAVNDVSFELRRGECLGLIGRNGAGKTTLLKMLNGLIKPDAGRITMRGRVGALIALGAGFNPILTGRENIYVNASILGLTKRETDAKLDEIIDFAELSEFIDSPVQSYSSGMQVRLGFAVATAMEPDVLLLDEVLAVGDASFRNKCYRRIVTLRKKAAVIFVSHSMEQISRICDQALVMSRGKLSFLGEVSGGVADYEKMNEEGGDQDDAFLSLNQPITGFTAKLELNEISSNAPIRILFGLASREPIRNFLLRMVVFNIAGSFAAECTISAHEHQISLSAGESCWEVTLASLPLKNGRYRVSFNVIDNHGDIIVWSYKQHEIRVTGGYFGAGADCQLQVQRWNSLPASSSAKVSSL